jgi:hypothetical protein
MCYETRRAEEEEEEEEELMSPCGRSSKTSLEDTTKNHYAKLGLQGGLCVPGS